MLKLLCLLAFAFAGSQCEEEDFETTACPQDDGINECVTKAIQKALPILAAKGSTKYGIPPLDPYYVEELTVEYQKNQIAVKSKMTDIYIRGLSTSQVKAARIEFEPHSFTLDVDMFSPKIFVEADYKVDGRFQTLRLNGKGYTNNTMHDVTYTWSIGGMLKIRPDKNFYISVYEFTMRPQIKEMEIYMSNLFPASDELTRLGNSLANQYWRVIYSELLPSIDHFWNDIGKKEASKIFDKLPLEIMFPRPPKTTASPTK